MNISDRRELLKIKDQVMTFERDFGHVVHQMIEVFNETYTKDAVHSIVVFLNGLRLTTHNKMPKLLAVHEERINSINSIWELFWFLSSLEMWDFSNYHVLTALTEEFLKSKPSVMELFSNHISKLEEFEEITSLCLYIIARNFTNYEPSKYYVLLEIELDRPCRNYSVREQEYVRKDLFEKKLNLLPWYTIAKGESEGSLHQWWAIPAALIPYLKEEVPKLSDFCSEYGIISIRLNGFPLIESKAHHSKLAIEKCMWHSATFTYMHVYKHIQVSQVLFPPFSYHFSVGCCNKTRFLQKNVMNEYKKRAEIK